MALPSMLIETAVAVAALQRLDLIFVNLVKQGQAEQLSESMKKFHPTAYKD